MKNIKWAITFLVINLTIICTVIICFLNKNYPLVGHDYSLVIPQMLDTYLHFSVNGLTIQWYTPSFGGGLPAFPDPNNSQFSFISISTLLFQPWQSIIISTIMIVILGGLGGYLFFRRILRLEWTSSVLGTIFFSANGFIIQRVAVGHLLGYQLFPILTVLPVLLLDTFIPESIAGLLFALFVAMLVHQSGFFVIVIFGISLLLMVPLIYIYRPKSISFKRIILIAVIGGGIGLLLSASKLAAVFAFMRFFPRQIADNYHTGMLKGLFGILLQLLGTMNLAPLLKLAGSHPSLLPNYMISITGAMYGYWEFDMSMSPIVFGIILIGGYGIIRNIKTHTKLFISDKKWIAWLLLIFFTWLAIEFTLAKGLVYPFLQKLPILSSLHVNPRFAAAFIFPLAIAAAIFYDKWTTKWSDKKSKIIFIIVNVFTLLPLCSYFLIHTDLQNRIYDITESQVVYNAIRSGDTLTITGIVSGVGNTDALLLHESNLQPYDPIFGYSLENFRPEIHTGSIWDVSDGYYNMTNPSGYVFPEINGTRPFERIPLSEKAKLEAFASHKQPDWKIPFYQLILDWVSGLTFLASVFILVLHGIKYLIVRFKNRCANKA